MEILIIVLVVIGALIAIASGIWVAIVLGSAISKGDKKRISESTKDS
jgi:energy-converting hydrogenase Eha subunit A